MSTSKIMKNGNINLPSKIRNNLNVKPGDRIRFIRTTTGYKIVPVIDIFELIDPSHKNKTIEMIEELHEERKQAAKGEME